MDKLNGDFEVDPAAVREELARVTASATFAGSDRLRRMLSVIVDRTLAGRPDELKEYSLALTVFERPESFDQRLDPIVRVQASNLRAKLNVYYATSGLRDAVRIDLPRGGYVARFSSNATAPDKIAVIAVLPCVDLSPSRDQEHLCDGITEEIISALSTIPGVRVIGRTSVFYFKTPPADLRDVGVRLGVENVLECSLRREGNRIRVIARFIQVTTGVTRWSRTFETEPRNVFEVEEEIAGAIADVLRLKLEARRPGRQICNNPEIYNRYLLARFHINKRTEQGLRRGMSILEGLISREIAQGPVLAATAEGHFLMALYGTEPATRAMPEAEKYARKALSLDDQLADPHAVLASIHALYEWDWNKSDRTFQRTLQLNPSHGLAHAAYAFSCLLPTGRTEQALRQLEDGVRLDPLSLSANFALAFGRYASGSLEVALRQCGGILDMEPSFSRAAVLEALIFLSQGEMNSALERARHAVALPDGFAPTPAIAASVFARAGDRKRAMHYIQLATERAGQNQRSSYWTALVYANLGYKDEAFLTLTKAYQERDPWLVSAAYETTLTQPLRTDQRFRALLRRLNLRALAPAAQHARA